MAALEGPDAQITLRRAAELAGLHRDTLKQAAQHGRLQAERPARDWFTTRRHLHAYLMHRSRGNRSPLPADYVAPDETSTVEGA